MAHRLRREPARPPPPSVTGELPSRPHARPRRAASRCVVTSEARRRNRRGEDDAAGLRPRVARSAIGSRIPVRTAERASRRRVAEPRATRSPAHGPTPEVHRAYRDKLPPLVREPPLLRACCAGRSLSRNTRRVRRVSRGVGARPVAAGLPRRRRSPVAAGLPRRRRLPVAAGLPRRRRSHVAAGPRASALPVAAATRRRRSPVAAVEHVESLSPARAPSPPAGRRRRRCRDRA